MENTTDNYVLLNGQLASSLGSVLKANNRGFQYGDGLFETIKVIDGNPCFLKNHVNRLYAGMKTLKMDIPVHFSEEFFASQIESLLLKNNISKGGRVRLTIFRNEGGNYIPENNGASWLIEAYPSEDNKYKLNEKGLNIDLYTEIYKPVNKLSLYKTANSMLYVLAGIWAKEKNLDDCLLVNSKDNIIEAISSNVFIISNGVLYTPSLDDGCVAGTMRMQIINLALEAKLKVYECALTPQNVIAADEIILTNAVAGIRWVACYRSKRYYNDMAKKLTEMLNNSVSGKKEVEEKKQKSEVNLEKGLPETSR